MNAARPFVPFVLSGAAILFTARLVSADTATEARFFDALARRAYDAGQYEAAFEAFVLVKEIAPSPRALYNIAVCADLAGKGDVAFEQYREYLAANDSDVARRQEAERRATRLESKLALLEIESDPPGADIYIDRKELGRYGVTPRTIAVASGERKVMLELPGFEPRAHSVEARVASTVRAKVALTPRFGVATVEVTPSSAKIEFLRNEKPVSFQLEEGRYRLPVGPYIVAASAPGYLSSKARLVVRENDTGWLALSLAPQPRPTGRLLVASGKVAAEVFVDGRRMAVTPATLSDIATGEHVVEVRAGARASSKRVTVAQDRATYVEVDLASNSK